MNTNTKSFRQLLEESLSEDQRARLEAESDSLEAVETENKQLLSVYKDNAVYFQQSKNKKVEKIEGIRI